jgi:hypothetical protein
MRLIVQIRTASLTRSRIRDADATSRIPPWAPLATVEWIRDRGHRPHCRRREFNGLASSASWVGPATGSGCAQSFDRASQRVADCTYTPWRADSAPYWGGNVNHALIRGDENCSPINAGLARTRKDAARGPACAAFLAVDDDPRIRLAIRAGRNLSSRHRGVAHMPRNWRRSFHSNQTGDALASGFRNFRSLEGAYPGSEGHHATRSRCR